jgi:xylulokinase
MADLLLTIDLGTSATKVALWDAGGMVARGRAAIPTVTPEPGRAEQDPEDWWHSIATATAEARAEARDRWHDIAGIAFSAARETVVPVADDGSAIGTAIIWSDRRARLEADELAAGHGGPDGYRLRTGVVSDAGTTAAKVLWLQAQEPERFAAARWLLAPRDFVVRRLTGETVSDPTMASRTGLYAITGEALPEVGADITSRLAPVVPSASVVGTVTCAAAEACGVRADVPVILGAGDRACEVLGSAATDSTPMVSWGTTANVSVPVDAVPVPVPEGIVVSSGALGGHILEAGLSAAGAGVAWLEQLTGLTPVELAEAAASSPPGARGVVAVPWLNGARAPWWHPGAPAALVNLSTGHSRGDVARAFYEAVAFEACRALDALDIDPLDSIGAVGGGVASSLWVELLAATTGVPVNLRRSGEAASAGACLIGAAALGLDMVVDRINPLVSCTRADDVDRARYAELRPLSDRVAGGIMGLDLSEWTT